MSKAVPNQSLARKSTGMSTTRMTSRQSGKMSGAHGCTSGNSNKGLYGRQNKIGQGCPGFGTGYGSLKKHGPSS